MVTSGGISTDVSAVHATTIASNVSALTLAPLAPVNDITRCHGTANQQTSAAAYVATASTNNTEPVNMYLGPIVAASTGMSYQLDLSAFKLELTGTHVPK